MMERKETITLTKEQETLLIPLYSKVVEGRRANPIFVDEKAREIVGRVDYDFSRLQVPRKTAITTCFRARKLDDYTREFLAEQAEGVVVQLGCGLDSRCLRAGARAAEWHDLDLPDVIELRRKFYPETDTYHLIASSVTEGGWLDRVAPRGRPVLVVAEGLLMYLAEAEVKALVLKLKAAFKGCRLAADVFSALTAERVGAHPSLRKTGATIKWGINDAHAVEGWAEGIRLREEWYFSQAAEIAKLGLAYRLAFKAAGLFAVANKAHRIVYYEL